MRLGRVVGTPKGCMIGWEDGSCDELLLSVRLDVRCPQAKDDDKINKSLNRKMMSMFYNCDVSICFVPYNYMVSFIFS